MDQATTGQIQQLREGENTNSRVEVQDRGRFGQTISVVMNEGQERMHGVDKMETEGNSKEGKLGIWKEEGFGWD